MTSPGPDGPTRTVVLPEEVVRGLEERMKGSAFENVDAFIAFVLGRLLDASAGTEAFSAEDERQLKERLRSLGYID
jgi:Arc/MetJ-type ribon-helix-helix transcriptional regulator